MKTRLLFAFLMFTIALQSQSLVLSYEGENIEPNGEITVEGSPWEYEILLELGVTNTSTNNIDVLIQRYETNMLPTTSSYICWLLCYLPEVSLTPYPLTLNAGQTSENDFSGHYLPNNMVGTSTLSYVFFDQNNPNDSTMITVHFDGVITGVNENTSLTAVAYPNPANEQIMININQQIGRAIQVELRNLSGQLIESVIAENGKAKFFTSGLKNGVYIYRILENGQLIYSNRVVIKH